MRIVAIALVLSAASVARAHTPAPPNPESRTPGEIAFEAVSITIIGACVAGERARRHRGA